MEFGRHIGKGLWAFADKALPAVYGLGFIFLVIRVLPPKEYGGFVLVQTVFMIATSLGYSLALQPLTKFAAEKNESGPFIVASLGLSALFFIATSVVVSLGKGILVELFDPERHVNLAMLLSYLPALFATAYYRNFAVNLLLAKYYVQKVFWIDVVFYVGTLVVIYAAQQLGRFHTAEDVLVITIISQSASTLLALLFTWDLLSTKLSIQLKAFSQIWNFGKFTFLGNAMYSAFSQMDVFFVSSFAGIVAVATYNAAKNFTRLFDMLSQVLQMLLVPFSSKAHSEQDTKNLTIAAEKAICFSTLLLFPVFFVMFLFPEQLLHLFYKGRYDQGTSIVRILSLLAFIVPWNAVAGSYLVGIGKVKQGFYYGAALAAVSLATYAILTPRLGALGTSIGLVLSSLLSAVALVKFIRHFIPLDIWNVVKRTGDVGAFIRTKILPKTAIQ